MSISSAFLFRFLDDVWDLLPTEDRQLFQSYWTGMIQIAANLEQKALEAAQSTEISEVPVFLTERWGRFVMDDDTTDQFEQTDELALVLTAPTPISRETAFYDTLKVTNSSGQIFHDETIRLFDDSVHELRYGKIVAGTLSVSLLGAHIEGTGAAITALDELTHVGAFANVREEMILKITAATPGSPVGIYLIRAVPDDDTVLIHGEFPVAAATFVDYEIADKLVEYTANRDYVVNLTEGTLQALDDGRIPPLELLTVNYRHEEYTIDLDYTIDQSRGQVERTSTSEISSGDTVSVVYTYNGTATLSLQGTKGAVAVAVLTDETKNFSTLLPGRTLIVASGPNAGTYPINAVLTPTQLQIATLFPSIQESDVVYSINAFPHGVKIGSNVESIPFLQNLIHNPETVLIEDVDFIVSGGILSSRTAFLSSEIGPTDLRKRQAWAEVVKINDETPYRNFGVLIDFFRENSEEYKLALQGLWFTFWTGSTPGNFGRGLHILLGLPFARREGTVTRVDTDLAEIDVTEESGRVITYNIPDGLFSTVATGDEVARFDSLTTGVQIIDRNNEPGFVTTRLGRTGIERYLTSNATTGPGDTDETKALTLLENHLFLPQILVEAITQRINVTELVTFLNNMRPRWTTYVFSFAVEESETLTLSEVLDPIQVDIDLTTSINNNEFNKSAVLDKFFLHKITGEILGTGSQATGNFRDFTVDFAALGIDAGDIVRIPAGVFKGYHAVLERQSSVLLSLDIPDASLQSVLSLEYYVLTEEQSRLDHDSIQLRKEHTMLFGTDYPAPATLNTKTDIDLDGLGLTNDEVKALLLVDIGIGGDEVQAITDADVTTSEFDVGTSPGTVTRDHEVASAALKRTDNTGPTVTDAFAI